MFESDQLVQVYDNYLSATLSTTHKLLLQWSASWHIAQRTGNSYALKTLEGLPIPGWVHARHLREFVPCKGTNLDIDEEGREEGRRRDEETAWKDTIGDKEEEEEDGTARKKMKEIEKTVRCNRCWVDKPGGSQ